MLTFKTHALSGQTEASFSLWAIVYAAWVITRLAIDGQGERVTWEQGRVLLISAGNPPREA